jgi:hypothetical protein
VLRIQRKEHHGDRLLATEELVALFRAPWDDNRWPANTFDRMASLQAVLGQHTKTWLPRCGPLGTSNGVKAALRPGLIADLVTLQQRWETYLDDQNILDFATIQRRLHDGQDAVDAAPRPGGRPQARSRCAGVRMLGGPPPRTGTRTNRGRDEVWLDACPRLHQDLLHHRVQQPLELLGSTVGHGTFDPALNTH